MLILVLPRIIHRSQGNGSINAVVITSVSPSSTRAGTVVLSYGAYFIVVAMAVRSRNSKMTNISSDINFNKVLL